MKKIIFLLSALFLTGCGTTSPGVYKDGKEVSGWSDLYQDLIRRNHTEEADVERRQREVTEQNCNR